MSTVIMNGYLLDFKDLMQLQENMMEFRKKIEKKEKELLAKLQAKMIVNFIDDMSLEKDVENYIEERKSKESYFDTDYSISFYTDWKIREKQKEIQITKRRSPAYDFDCSVVIIPIKNKVLAMLYTEKEEYKKIWEKIKGVKRYYYWNNTDKPRNISEKQWEQRSNDWDEALSYKGIPSLNGFTVECKNEYMYVELKDIIRVLPSYEERVYIRAKQKTLQEKFNELIAPNKETPTYLLINKMNEAQEWLKTEEGNMLIVKNKEYMERMLMREINKELLLMSMKNLLVRIKEQKESL